MKDEKTGKPLSGMIQTNRVMGLLSYSTNDQRQRISPGVLQITVLTTPSVNIVALICHVY